MGSTKVLLIGAGRWGRNHLKSLLKLGVDLYLSDLTDAGLGFAKEAGLASQRMSKDYREFADEVDAYDIVTPADSHYELCLEAIERGKDAFVEKPLTLESSGALELARMADEAEKLVQVGHIFRYDEATQWIKSRIEAGAIGAPKWMEARFLGFKRPRPDSGVSFADALHFIDLFNYLLDKTPLSVEASFADVLQRGMEDTSYIMLDYAGVFASVHANYFYPGKERKVAVVGEDASILCDFDAPEKRIRFLKNRHYNENGVWKAEAGDVITPDVAPGDNLKKELAEFIACVQSRRSPRAGAYDGYKVVRILEAARESATTCRTVELEQ
jgi:UDP-2-acetamido-3-amino-2,3-dideoxy-glucuronate N-acetyltransferase